MRRLHLHPIAAIPGTVGSCTALRDNTLKLQALGRLEQLHTVIEAFDEVKARYLCS